MKRLLILLLLLPTLGYGQTTTVVGSPVRSSGTQTTLCLATSLAVATTGTSEEQLGKCTIPANTFPSRYAGFEAHVQFSAAANVNSKTVRLRMCGIGGTQTNISTSAVNAETWELSIKCLLQSATYLQCIAANNIQTAAVGGVSYVFAFNPAFGSDCDLSMTAATATSAGDVTLRAYSVTLINR